MDTKTCNTCNLILSIDSFDNTYTSGKKFGLRNKCKKCRRKETNKDVTRAAKKRFYIAHKDDILKQQKETYPGRRDAAILRASNWNKENIERRRVISKNSRRLRRARIAGNEIELTHAQWEDILWLHNSRCIYCLSTSKIEMDHVIPISKNGEHAYWNVVPSCRSCNARKSANLGRPTKNLQTAGRAKSSFGY